MSRFGSGDLQGSRAGFVNARFFAEDLRLRRFGDSFLVDAVVGDRVEFHDDFSGNRFAVDATRLEARGHRFALAIEPLVKPGDDREGLARRFDSAGSAHNASRIVDDFRVNRVGLILRRIELFRH